MELRQERENTDGIDPNDAINDCREVCHGKTERSGLLSLKKKLRGALSMLINIQ